MIIGKINFCINAFIYLRLDCLDNLFFEYDREQDGQHY